MALCTPNMGGALFVPEHGTYLQLQPVLIPYIGGALFVHIIPNLAAGNPGS